MITKSEKKAINEFVKIAQRILRDNLVEIILYGSKARGDFISTSDIDLLILVNRYDFRLRDRLADIAADLLLKYKIHISPVLMSKNKFKYLYKIKLGYLENVKKEGINLWKAA